MKFKIKSTGEVIKVYQLKQGTPTAEHIFCDATPFKIGQDKPFGHRTFTRGELTAFI